MTLLLSPDEVRELTDECCRAVWIEWYNKNGRIRIRISGNEPWDALWREAWASAIRAGYTPPRWWQWWRWNDSKPNEYYPPA